MEGTDGLLNDGVILMWNDPRGQRSPWANGTVDKPYGDGLLFVSRYGTGAVNRDVASIEISGRTWGAALSERSRQAIAALTAYWADQYKVSWETFPVIPGEGNRSFVVWHQEFTIGTGKVCPGQQVMSETGDLIRRAKEILRNHQTAIAPPPLPPEYAIPKPVAAGTRFINDRLFLDVSGKQYTLTKQTTPRLWAGETSPATGATMLPGHIVQATHVVRDVGEASELTLVLADGSRIPGSSVA